MNRNTNNSLTENKSIERRKRSRRRNYPTITNRKRRRPSHRRKITREGITNRRKNPDRKKRTRKSTRSNELSAT